MKPHVVLLVLLGLTLGLTSELLAGVPPRPRGIAVEVAETTVGDQSGISVAATPAGDFVVSWQGDVAPSIQGGAQQGTFFRDFDGRSGDPTHGEVFLDTPGQYAALAVADDRTALVVWEVPDGDGRGLRGRRCRDETCSATFPINTTTVGEQRSAAVAATPSGGFLVVWTSEAQDSDGSQAIIGRFFPASPGTPGSERVINQDPAGDQKDPAVAFSRVTLDFTVVWEGPTGSGDGLVARRFDPQDGPQGNDVVIVGSQAREPAVAIEPDGAGHHVFAWTAPDSDGSGILGRVFDSVLSQGSSIFLVNAVVQGNQYSPAVAADSGGGATFVWLSTEPPPFLGDLDPLLGSPIFLKGIKGAGGGGLVGGPQPPQFSDDFLIGAGTGLADPRVAAQGRGNFVVSWEQDAQFDLGVFVRRYGALIFADGFETGNAGMWSAVVGGT